MRRNIFLYLLVLVLALSVVYVRHHARGFRTALERHQVLNRGYETEFRQLQLEQSTWATSSRIEAIATTSLHMQVPDANQVQLIDIPEHLSHANRYPTSEVSK